jgi:general secretion pathway protein I
MRAVAQSTDSATLLKQRTLAMWVAQNRLAAAQLATTLPATGTHSGDAVQAGARFVWQETVSGTPNPVFRKVEIVVADAAQPDYALARLVGFLAQPARR